MAEKIGNVPDFQKWNVQIPPRTAPEPQVTKVRLPADQKLIGQDVPGSALNPSLLDVVDQPVAVLRSNLEVVTKHDCLTVEQEVVKVGISVERVQQGINEIDEADPKVLEGSPPLTVPVCVMDDVHPVVGPLAPRALILL
jgi:hypothetical protein